MIRVFLLLFDPTPTWEKIDKEQHGVLRAFLAYLLPLILLSALAEGLLIKYYGREVGPLDQIMAVPREVLIRYEAARIAFALLIAFGGSLVVRRLGASFHSRHEFRACFITLAYSLGPCFLLQIAAGFPAISTWLVWSVGILLSISVLYRGIPRTLRPEPSNALGLYLFLSVFLIIASGLAQYISTLILEQRILTGVPLNTLLQK